jgi:hypothetical protein
MPLFAALRGGLGGVAAVPLSKEWPGDAVALDVIAEGGGVEGGVEEQVYTVGDGGFVGSVVLLSPFAPDLSGDTLHSTDGGGYGTRIPR